jgi:hypothetical protein
MAAGDGLVIMTPTSIAHSGTSASINADGGVDFTAVTSLSLNGVFTSSFDNYRLVFRAVGSIKDLAIRCRLRAAGSDNSTANSYVSQIVFGDSTTVGASRATSDFGRIVHISSDREGGAEFHLYGPFLAQPTAGRSVVSSGYDNAYLDDSAFTHNQSTSYDGITFYFATANMTGNVVVFGYEE